jgi:hypothetical protein
MGTFSKGLFGAFRGKVGNMVGSTWKGIEVVKSKPARRKGKFTADQLQQQAKFALMVRFLQPLTPLLDQAYNSGAVQMSGFNKALSFNILNAVTGEYPAFKVDYQRVILGQGKLSNADSPKAASTAAGKLSVAWADNTGSGSAQASDTAFVAVYCEELNRWAFSQNAAVRTAGTLSLDVASFSGKVTQTWFGFVSAKGKQVSTSLFAGEVTVL